MRAYIVAGILGLGVALYGCGGGSSKTAPSGESPRAGAAQSERGGRRGARTAGGERGQARQGADGERMGPGMGGEGKGGDGDGGMMGGGGMMRGDGGGMMGGGGGMMGGGGSEQGGQQEQQLAKAGKPPALSGKVENGVRVIEMKAFRYSYDPDTVVVKEGQPVRLVITSTDVEHGIGIDAFKVNKVLPVHKATAVQFTPNKTGEFKFYCTVYCGPGHADMKGKLIVVK